MSEEAAKNGGTQMRSNENSRRSWVRLVIVCLCAYAFWRAAQADYRYRTSIYTPIITMRAAFSALKHYDEENKKPADSLEEALRYQGRGETEIKGWGGIRTEDGKWKPWLYFKQELGQPQSGEPRVST